MPWLDVSTHFLSARAGFCGNVTATSSMSALDVIDGIGSLVGDLWSSMMGGGAAEAPADAPAQEVDVQATITSIQTRVDALNEECPLECPEDLMWWM